MFSYLQLQTKHLNGPGLFLCISWHVCSSFRSRNELLQVLQMWTNFSGCLFRSCSLTPNNPFPLIGLKLHKRHGSSWLTWGICFLISGTLSWHSFPTRYFFSLVLSRMSWKWTRTRWVSNSYALENLVVSEHKEQLAGFFAEGGGSEWMAWWAFSNGTVVKCRRGLQSKQTYNSRRREKWIVSLWFFSSLGMNEAFPQIVE